MENWSTSPGIDLTFGSYGTEETTETVQKAYGLNLPQGPQEAN